MSKINECASCEQKFIATSKNKKFCGDVCLSAFSKAVAREKFHNFYNNLSELERMILNEILDEERGYLGSEDDDV